MPITLPEALLLFALHDDRGTVHSAAYLALDPGLRGAVLSELKLRGYVQVRTTGDIRFHPAPPAPPTIPFLREALDAVARCASPAPVGVWVDALAAALPDLRTRVRTALERRGILVEAPQAGGLGLVSYTVTDPQVERAIRDRLLAELDLHEALAPRWGSLIGLTVACHLATVVFGERGGEADARATWIADRDAVLRAVVSSIAETEGQL